MGIYVVGQSAVATPVEVPLSTGDIHTLPKVKFATLLGCMGDHLDFTVAPMSTLFDPTHHIVCAYSHGYDAKVAQQRLKQFPNMKMVDRGEGRLCRDLVYMTSELRDGFGHQINGSAIFFYLEKGKDFLAVPDMRAARRTQKQWSDSGDGLHPICTRAVFEGLKDRFYRELETKDSDDLVGVKTVKGIWIPALGTKAVLVKVQVQILRSDEDPTRTFDFSRFEEWLGVEREENHETPYGEKHRPVYRLPSVGTLDPAIEVSWRDGFLVDGSPKNQTALFGTKGKMHHPWAGNILALKYLSNRDMDHYGDMEMQDAKLVFEYLSCYGRSNNVWDE